MPYNPVIRSSSGSPGCLSMGKLLACVLLIFLVKTLQAQNLEHIGDQQAIRLTSGMAIQTTFYRVNMIPYRRQPFNWSFSGTPVLHVYGIQLPFSFYFSNQQLGFQQPFNQFGISPSYKWATAHLGYSSVTFSDYTLAGRRFLGAGAELNPGKWRLGFVYGRFQKAVAQDSVVHATPEGYLSGVPNGAFARKGYAVKLGYGTPQNFVDLLLLRAADDTTSLTDPFSLDVLTPERNTAVGIKHRLSGESGFFWESDAALSYYTRDTRSEAVDTGDVPSFLYKIFDPKITGQLLYAATSRLGYDGKTFRASLKYRRISRDFKTMGAYYYQTDLQEVAVQASTGLFQKKLQLRGSLGIRENNLGNGRLHTTKRVIASCYAGAQLSRQLRADVLYSNSGITQRPQQPGLTDSIRIDQVLNLWQLSMNYQIPASRPQTVSLQFNIQDLAPRDVAVTQVSAMRALTGTGVYALSIPDLRMQISLVGQGIWNKQEAGTLRSLGGGITLSKSFADNTLTTQGGLRIFTTQFEEMESNGTTSLDAALNYRITDSWSASIKLRYTGTKTSGQYPAVPFHETLVTLGSQFHF